MRALHSSYIRCAHKGMQDSSCGRGCGALHHIAPHAGKRARAVQQRANGGRSHLLVCTGRCANGERPTGGYHEKAQVSSAMQASMVATSARSQRLPTADIASSPREGPKQPPKVEARVGRRHGSLRRSRRVVSQLCAVPEHSGGTATVSRATAADPAVRPSPPARQLAAARGAALARRRAQKNARPLARRREEGG